MTKWNQQQGWYGENTLKLLIAEDDITTRTILEGVTLNWGYDPIVVEDGEAAWDVMKGDNPPSLLLIDWEMPKINGLELCDLIRKQTSKKPPYIILLTVRSSTNDIVLGLKSGSNDYISKPFEKDELHARLQVGMRMLELQEELINAKDEVAMQTKRLSAIFDNIVDGLITFSDCGVIETFNPAAKKIFGYCEEEVIGQNIKNLMLRTDNDNIDINWGKKNTAVPKKMIGIVREVIGFRKDGSTFHMDLAINEIRIDNLRYFVGTVRDISDRKRLESQLQIRQRMDSLGNLVGGVAHDFNNILGALSGNLELLNMRTENFNDKQSKFLANATKCTVRAIELTKQFQSLSTSSTENITTIDIHEIAEDVFGLISETTNRLIRKEVRLNKGEFLVLANYGELHQVLLNLATNSTHSIEEREVTNNDFIQIAAENYLIKIGDRTKLTEGEYIHISFKDTGSGMTNEILMKAFDPMFTTKDKGTNRGQGLGLAMVYNIITVRNHGFIEIDSEEGKGTTFHIYLPKNQSDTMTDDIKTLSIKGGSEIILLVDDDDMVISMAKEILNVAGYTVLIANNGNEALNIYAQNIDAISVVILDLNMPNMSGKQVLQKMLNINPEVKVIISSGLGVDDSQQEQLSEAKGNLSKPYKSEDLYRVVRETLDE